MNTELKAMFDGSGDDEKKAPALDIDDGTPKSDGNFAEPQTYLNKATGQETEVQFRDAYSQANQSFKITWGEYLLIFCYLFFESNFSSIGLLVHLYFRMGLFGISNYIILR